MQTREELEKLKTCVIAGKANEAKKQTEELLMLGISAREILDEGLIPAMDVVGEHFKESRIYIPDVLMSSRAMHAGLHILKPVLSRHAHTLDTRIVLGTVAGDLHDIGKNLVGMMMKSKGFEVIDLGIDVTAEKFVASVHDYQPRILGLSALLTITMPVISQTIRALEEAGLRKNVLVMIGGNPVTWDYASLVGADLYAPDAISAGEIAYERIVGDQAV